jgi:glucosamine kinase
MTRVLGLDIGATGSRAQLCVDGEIVAESKAASASVVAVGPASAKAALADILAQLPLDPQQPLDAVCAGSAGISVRGTRQFLSEHLAPLARPGRTVIVKDAMLILPAAGLDEGVALICGTGSVAIGTYQGHEMQCGGWGHLLGDEGSGYWIVRTAIRELLSRLDQGVPPGALGASLLEAAGAADLTQLRAAFYRQPEPRNWARHAPAVLDCRDPAAADITGQAALALADLAGQAARRLAAPDGIPVVLAGGLMEHKNLLAATVAAVEAALPASPVHALADPPVAGAVRLAMAAARDQP